MKRQLSMEVRKAHPALIAAVYGASVWVTITCILLIYHFLTRP